jgi:plastocyanin
MQRRTFLAAVGTGVTVSLAGCGMVGGADDADVEMAKNAYLPETFETTVGETVVWVNNGSRGHTVTAYESGLPDGAEYWASGGFESEQAARNGFWEQGGQGSIRPGETWAHTFEVAGEYPYVCIPHERAGMVGTVVVTE